MKNLEVFAVEKEGRRYIGERPEVAEPGERYMMLGEIRLPAGILETLGMELAVKIAREVVKKGLCDAAVIDKLQNDRTMRERLVIYEKWKKTDDR